MRRLTHAKLRPPTLPPRAVVPITLAFAVLSLTRGLDWAGEHKPGTVAQVMLDNNVGLRTWGIALIVGALLLLVAYGSRLHFAVWCAHGLLAAVYVGIAITTIQALQAYGGDGVAQLAAPIGAVLWHGMLAYFLKPSPRDNARGGPRE